MQQMGVVTRDSSGDDVFDFDVLQRLLHERYEDYAARSGQRGGSGEELLRSAVQSAFKYAQQRNAYSLLSGKQLQCCL